MDSNQLIREIAQKLLRRRILVLGGALLMGAAAATYAWKSRPVYTSKATLFPLTTPNDNSLANSTLSGILGLGDAPKSFSSEATINIVELAQSRFVRETVSATRLPAFNNRSIAELLVQDINDHKGLLGSGIQLPKDSLQRVILGGELLKPNIVAKLSKNGVLELYYSGSNEELISPISFTLIEKISQFYIDLKRQKAIADYNFTLGKIDSFQNMLNSVDRQAIDFQRKTLFTPNDQLEFNLPQENIVSEKTRILRQRDMSINNRDEAVWRLQKATPIISTLDKPFPPFDKKKNSPLIFFITGLFLGLIITSLLLVARLIGRYIRTELHRSIYGS